MAGKVTITNDQRLRKFRKRIGPMTKGINATVGVQGQEAEEDHPGSDVSMATVAAAHEFGTDNNRPPQRSFLRDTLDLGKQRYAVMLVKGAREVAKGRGTTEGLMFRVGETLRQDVIKRIKAGIPPDLSEVTKARKDSSLPLVDKGFLVAAITSVVHKGPLKK